MSLLALKGKWWKPGGDDPRGMPVDVIVRGFAQATISENAGTRPVAIVQETLGDSPRMRYVELKFLEIEGEMYGQG